MPICHSCTLLGQPRALLEIGMFPDNWADQETFQLFNPGLIRGSSQGNLVQLLEDMTGIIGAHTPGRMCDWMASRYATGLAGTWGYTFSRDGWWVIMEYTYQKGRFLQLD